MTDETTHPPLEEILEKIFGPVGHATPEQAYWPRPNVIQAAHDYTHHLRRGRMKETPFITMLRAYGVDPMTVPERATFTSTRQRDGIYIETLCFDEDGNIAIDDLNSTIVTRNAFHPHP
ncbi:hypothetical protein [Dermabacter hominis]